MRNADLRLRENADEFVANQARDFYTSVRAAQIHQIVTENRIFRLLTKLNFQEKSIWKSNLKCFWLQNLCYWITIILWDRTRRHFWPRTKRPNIRRSGNLLAVIDRRPHSIEPNSDLPSLRIPNEHSALVATGDDLPALVCNSHAFDRESMRGKDDWKLKMSPFLF